MENKEKPVFKALFDTNALSRILGDILAVRRGNDPTYPNIFFAIDNEFLKIYVTPTVLNELHGGTVEADRRITLLHELMGRNIVITTKDTECCYSKILRECTKDLENFLKPQDPADYEIVKEYFAYIETSTGQSRIEEIPFLFITENKKDFTTNIASTITRCIMDYITLELQRRGYATPAGVYNLEWLDYQIGKILENIAKRLREIK
ncbi:MAG: hypothetical protein J7K21_02240 [Desulfurococcales archaeon]|nr:hypothetical protein [Desulfurococcales archaeon]